MRQLIAVTLLLGSLFLLSAPAAASPDDLVPKWAPVIYGQRSSASPTTQDNIFTTVDFDSDWRTNNNWQNLPFHPPQAAVYYSLVETQTHYYIGYYLYFPRYKGTAEIEHSLGGILAAIRKDPGGNDSLDGVVIYDRNRFRWRDGRKINDEGGHLLLAVDADNHELWVVDRNRKPPAYAKFPPPTSEQEVPAASTRQNQMWVHGGYRLVPLEELWDRRQEIGPGRTFGRWGYLDNASFTAGAGALPWIWEYRRINWLAQPAELIGQLRGIKGEAAQYLDNPYAEVVK